MRPIWLLLGVLLGQPGLARADITPITPPSTKCEFWRGVTRVVTRHETSPIFYLELELDLQSGVARITDHRAESADDRTKKIFGDDQHRMTNALYAICPTAEQLKARCAPGRECLSITVIRPAGSTTDRDPGTAGAAQRILASIFPELRL